MQKTFLLTEHNYGLFITITVLNKYWLNVIYDITGPSQFNNNIQTKFETCFRIVSLSFSYLHTSSKITMVNKFLVNDYNFELSLRSFLIPKPDTQIKFKTDQPTVKYELDLMHFLTELSSLKRHFSVFLHVRWQWSCGYWVWSRRICSCHQSCSTRNEGKNKILIYYSFSLTKKKV